MGDAEHAGIVPTKTEMCMEELTSQGSDDSLQDPLNTSTTAMMFSVTMKIFDNNICVI